MLSPLAWLYGGIVATRASLYKNGFFKSYPLGVPTISIGNLTAGGTGKTPLVAFIARFLAEEGEKVCVLTRGYGRENPNTRVLVTDAEKILADVRSAGDEPAELARKLLGRAIIVADADRVGAGRWAREKFGITAFVLDDAFQHLRVRRDLNIVTVDATDPFGNGKMLPAGILREPLKSLSRADLVVITRANLGRRISDLRSRILNINPRAEVLVSENKISGLIRLGDFQISDQEADEEQVKNEKILAFCALGNPENFFEQIRREGFNLISTEKFPDHHFYTQNDISQLEQKAARHGADIFITTAKDAVKLKDIKFKLPCLVAENNQTFDDEKRLHELLRAALEKNSIRDPKSKTQNP